MTIGRREIGVLADDLTGACDVAASLSRRSGAVAVRVRADAEAVADGLEVLNTQSRALAPAEARAAVRPAASALRSKRVILKKIDAALRGSVGAEIDEALAAAGPRRAILAPALPAIGRTTVDGAQCDRGVPIHLTDYARDPSSAIRTSRLIDILGKTAWGVRSLEIRDAATDDELRRIAAEGLETGERVLFVGSLGLAAQVASFLDPESAPTPAPSAGPVLLLNGSVYPRAREQVHLAAAHWRVPVWVRTGSGWRRGPADAARVDRDEQEPGSHAAALVVACTEGAAGGITPDRRRAPGPEADPVLKEFAAAGLDLARRIGAAGVGVIGGDTAYAFFDGAATRTLTVHGQAEDVISWGRVNDGLVAETRFALKGGSVGEPDAALSMAGLLGLAPAG